MSITRGVLAQSPEPEGHDKVFDNYPDRIGIWKCWFLRREKTGVPGEKPLGARTRTNNKLNPHMTPSPGIGNRTSCVGGKCSTTAPSLLPINYLQQLRNFNERRNLVKFKLSNHKLMIKLGRYQTDHISRENRLCPLCKSNQIENETHFLLDCSKYSSQRRTFLNRINELIPNFERKSTSESIKLLMNCNDYHVNKLVMKFISSCMNIRDALLQSSESDVT